MYPSAKGMASRPIAPLPNPGEGGPVGPGSNVPGTLLPAPGEGGPVGPDSNVPGGLLPGPGAGGPVDPGNSTPGTLLPGPGEGGPVAPGGGLPIVPMPDRPVPPGQILPIFPQPGGGPCFFCVPGRRGRVRFLNAATGYEPLQVYINNRFIVNGLSFASVTPYGQVSDGFQTITVMGMNGYIYLQKPVLVQPDEKMTIAIINTVNGLDLFTIADTTCFKAPGFVCYRVCNLATYANPLDVVLSNGRVLYGDVRFKEVTPFRRARAGEYEFYLTNAELRPMPRELTMEIPSINRAVRSQPVLVSYLVNMQARATYTTYILSYDSAPDALQVLTLEDR